jgi:hypothetical protein
MSIGLIIGLTLVPIYMPIIVFFILSGYTPKINLCSLSSLFINFCEGFFIANTYASAFFILLFSFNKKEFSLLIFKYS